MGKPGAAAPPVFMSRSLTYCRSSSCGHALNGVFSAGACLDEAACMSRQQPRRKLRLDVPLWAVDAEGGVR